MIKIMFICLGNICRSPMAEFVFKDLIAKDNLNDHFKVASSGTWGEVGRPVHRGTRDKLKEVNISISQKTAWQFKKSDYDHYDYLIAMDQNNVNDIKKIVGNDKDLKIYRLLDFSNDPHDIADPWYTGNFDVTYDDILQGCRDFLTYLKHRYNL